MESSSREQLQANSPEMVAAGEGTCNLNNCNNQISLPNPNKNNNYLQDVENTLNNKDAMTNTLRKHIEKLEELYKKIVYQSEENRLNYCMALQELENYKLLRKISHKGSKKCKEKCNKEMTVNLCSIDNHQLNENSVLPLHYKISNATETTNNSNDPFIVIKRGVSDIKIHFTVEKRATGVCNCCNNPEDRTKPNITKEMQPNTTTNIDQNNTFLEIKDSITKRLREENEILKREIATLREQLETGKLVEKRTSDDEGEGSRIVPPGRSVSFFVIDNTEIGTDKKTDANKHKLLEIKYDSLMKENEGLKEQLKKALDDLDKMKIIGMESCETDEQLNDETNTQISILNPDFLERIDEMYQQQKVSGKLINEIFWQLEQLQNNMQSVRKILEDSVQQSEPKSEEKPLPPPENKSIIEKTTVHRLEREFGKIKEKSGNLLVDENDVYDYLLIESKSAEEKHREKPANSNEHPVDLKKSAIEGNCDVATNCYSFCLCESDDNNKSVAEKSVNTVPMLRSSIRSTELKEENLDVEATSIKSSNITAGSMPVDDYILDRISRNAKARTSSCSTSCNVSGIKKSENEPKGNDSLCCEQSSNKQDNNEYTSTYSASYAKYLTNKSVAAEDKRRRSTCSSTGHVSSSVMCTVCCKENKKKSEGTETTSICSANCNTQNRRESGNEAKRKDFAYYIEELMKSADNQVRSECSAICNEYLDI